LFVASGDSFITRLPFDAATGTLRGAAEMIPVPGVPGVRGLAVSHDGTRLAFAGVSLDSQIWKQPVRAGGESAGDAVALTRDTSRRNSLPVISPDATRIAYVSIRSGEQPNLWLMDMNGQASQQLTSAETPEHKPEWSRDGTRVAYVSQADYAPSLRSIDVNTRRDEPLFALSPSEGEARLPGWFGELQLGPSMSAVAFSMLTPPVGRRALYVSGTDRFAPHAITEDTVSAGYPAWSPDEKRIAVEVKDGMSMQAGVVDIANRTTRMLTNERGQTWVRSWSPDGRSLAVAAMRDGLWSLRAIDVASGRQQTILAAGLPRVYVRYPEWSSRGDVIVFERGEMRANLWAISLVPRPAMTR
jgi:Tol biopolymer transport system component